MKTASINLATHELKIWASFLNKLEKECGLSPENSLEGILNHEIGHYMVFPHDLAAGLYLRAVAEGQFGKKYKNIVNFYADAVVNIDCLRSSVRKNSLLQLLKSMYSISSATENRIIAGLYQKYLSIDLGMSPAEEESAVINELAKIDYIHPWTDIYYHASNILNFGKALLKAPKEKQTKPKIKRPAACQKDQEKYVAALPAQFSKVVCSYLHPLLQQSPQIVLDNEDMNDGEDDGNGEDGDSGLDEYSEDEINDALDKISKQHGKLQYDFVKNFIKRELPDVKDRYEHPKDIMAGTSIGELEFNNDQIPYYKRKAAQIGVYIIKKPLIDDGKVTVPYCMVPFEPGDEFHKINPFSSPWILPEILQRWEDASFPTVELNFKIPDLFVMLDSSGSMLHPRYMSHAVLTAIVLGNNYHKNGAMVGLGNFSTKILLIPPSRDLEKFEEGACAYWGGGTVLNTARIMEWISHLGDKSLDGVIIDDQLFEKLGRPRKEFEEKHCHVRLEEQLPKIYEKLDNILITDGAIFNISEVVDYLNSTAKVARNTIFLINSPAEYEQWKKLELKNTSLYHIEKPENLLEVSIGKVKDNLFGRCFK